MPRTKNIVEWVGGTDDSMPGPQVRDRLCRNQGDRCKCGRPFGPQCRPQCDHVKPLRDGGENRESNLQMLCNWCHVEKTSAEATNRKKASRIRAKRMGLDQVRSNRWGTRPLGTGNDQHTATSPVIRKADRANRQRTSP